jgi:carboxymethylenebutenolidase
MKSLECVKTSPFGLRICQLLLTVAFGALDCRDAFAQDHDHAAMMKEMAAQVGADVMSLPADEDSAATRLSTSPRHGEWVKIDVAGTPVNTWVVYPERRTKAPVVLLIHEIFGLTDWMRAVADQVAAEGFIALAPDLLSGHGPGGGGTEAYAVRDEVIKATSSLERAEVNARLNGVREYGITLPAANGKSASVGFCWGGSSSFAYAVAQPALNAAVVYYGSAPAERGAAPTGSSSFAPTATLADIRAPVLGLYGENDARVTATVRATAATMKSLRKRFEHQIYNNAGHGFLRAQTGQNGANMKATEKAWTKTVAFLRQHTR